MSGFLPIHTAIFYSTASYRLPSPFPIWHMALLIKFERSVDEYKLNEEQE